MPLKPDTFRHYIDKFNSIDNETVRNAIPNENCWDWMCENIPWFECPDEDIQEIYYFRWWVFRKHLKETPSGFVITEFLPEVHHAGRHNTIACAAGLHIEEARWLRNRRYASDYIRFWFSEEGDPRKYSNWLAHAILGYCEAVADFGLAEALLGSLATNHRERESSNQHESGLFWSRDDRDGGEYSISGDGLRPTLNSYMYGDAVAIAAIASRCGQRNVSAEFAEKAVRLRSLVQERLWDPAVEFFKNFVVDSRDRGVDSWDFSALPPERNVREVHGYFPWKFSLPEPGYENAWRALADERAFAAPHGPSTAEQQHPRFMKYRVKGCQWDGASWPFATSLTIGSLAVLLHEYRQDVIGKAEFFDLLKSYARSQHRVLPYGEEIPWIGEDLHPHSGIWLARAIGLEVMYHDAKDLDHYAVRGKDYNHSSYCDLVISGLVGLQFGDDGAVVVDPLIPDGTWDWFCLDCVEYGGKRLTIQYDRTGKKYGRRSGLSVLADGTEIGHSRRLAALRGTVTRLVEHEDSID